jgi:hypothetical protein
MKAPPSQEYTFSSFYFIFMDGFVFAENEVVDMTE